MTDLHHDLNIPIAESRNIKEAKSAFFANLPAPVSVRGCHGTEDLLSAGPSDLDRQRDSCRTRFSPSRPSLSPSVPAGVSVSADSMITKRMLSSQGSAITAKGSLK